MPNTGNYMSKKDQFAQINYEFDKSLPIFFIFKFIFFFFLNKFCF